jgi:uncharacterized cupin superfamily protein
MHYANEEMLLVLDGVLELRTPNGTREVGKGAVVAFPAGAEGSAGDYMTLTAQALEADSAR